MTNCSGCGIPVTAAPAESSTMLCVVCQAIGVDQVPPSPPPPPPPPFKGMPWHATEPAFRSGVVGPPVGPPASFTGTGTVGGTYWLRVFLVGVCSAVLTIALLIARVNPLIALFVVVPLVSGCALAFACGRGPDTAASFVVGGVSVLMVFYTGAKHLAWRQAHELHTLDPSIYSGIHGPFARLRYTVAVLFQTRPPAIILLVFAVAVQGGATALVVRLLRRRTGATRALTVRT